jgi:hypothetical protein
MPKKIEVELGSVYGRLTVIGFTGSDAHRKSMVVVRCSCPAATEKAVRVSRLTMEPYVDGRGKLRLPTRSCGCEAKEAFKQNIQYKASCVPPAKRIEIWSEFQCHQPVQKIAADYGQDIYTTWQVIRDANTEAQALSKLARPIWIMFWKAFRPTVEKGGWMRFKGEFTTRELQPQTEDEAIVTGLIAVGLSIAREWKRWSKSSVTWVAEVMEMAIWIEKTFRRTKRSLNAYRFGKKRRASQKEPEPVQGL